MDSPRYSVIVPMRRFGAEEPVLVSLRNTVPSGCPPQILVAEGSHPSLQRNAALDRAKGDIIVFLDNDCCLGAGFWAELDAAFARPEVDIVGGPARLRPNPGAWEEIFHSLLTHPLIVGPVSARYAPRGIFRRAGETDLILCNLSVRRSVFDRVERLSPQLYPNEENEWLDRAAAAGLGIYYQPALQVFRPQRSTPYEMARMLLRNGMGRTRQFQVSGWRPTFHQLLPGILIAGLTGLYCWHLEVELLALWLVVAIAVAVTGNPDLVWWRRGVAGLVAPFIPLIYVVGQCLGWIALLGPSQAPSSRVTVVNERGETDV